MKHLHRFFNRRPAKSRTHLLFYGVLFAAALFCSCSQESSTIAGIDPAALKPGTISSPAHPALAYSIATTSKLQGQTAEYANIGVMDTDGTHQTNLYRASSPVMLGGTYQASGDIEFPCWSPVGGSIAWIEGKRTIRAIDISVNSSGIPVGSNVRTIYTSGDTINGLIWCSMAATGKLAFTTHKYSSSGVVSTLYTISQNGGTPGSVRSVSDSILYSPTWSPDDSRIGVLQRSRRYNSVYWLYAPYSQHLKVVNSSNGALLEDDDLTALSRADNCEWARSGNTIAFTADNGNTTVIDYIDYGAGTGPYSQNVSGSYPTWSPNNATIMFLGPFNNTGTNPLQKINAFGSTVTTVLTNFRPVKWKR